MIQRLLLCAVVPRFLLIQTAFLGDVVLATAVVEKLAIFYPGATIDFVVRKGAETLLAHNPHLRKVWTWDKHQSKGFNLLKLIRDLRKEKYTHAINMQRFFSSGLLTVLSGAGYTAGYKKNPLSRLFTHAYPHLLSTAGTENPIHEINRNQQLIALLTDALPAQPRIYPGAADETAVENYKSAGPYYTLSPASVWATKQYPVQGWAALLNALPAANPVYLLGGKGDMELANAIIAEAERKGHIQNLCGTLSFGASAALMRDAVHNWTNDSAPLHLCSGVGAAVTAVFCSTVPAFGFGPTSPRGRIAEINDPLSCRPCGLHGHRACPEGHFKCAWDIKLEALLPPESPVV